MKKNTQVARHTFKYKYETLADFNKWIRECVPPHIPDQKVILDFCMNNYSEYDLYGENHTYSECELMITIEEEEGNC
jgi:hypothetical protein